MYIPNHGTCNAYVWFRWDEDGKILYKFPSMVVVKIFNPQSENFSKVKFHSETKTVSQKVCQQN